MIIKYPRKSIIEQHKEDHHLHKWEVGSTWSEEDGTPIRGEFRCFCGAQFNWNAVDSDEET